MSKREATKNTDKLIKNSKFIGNIIYGSEGNILHQLAHICNSRHNGKYNDNNN